MKQKMVILLSMVLCAAGTWAAVGDVWELGDGLLASIDPNDPNYLTNSLNPVTVGDATWKFHKTDQATQVPTTFTVPLFNSFYGSLPTQGVGWRGSNPGEAHICLARFSIANGAETNYKVGEVGGHAPIGATWTTLTGGTFKIDFGAWNARTSKLDRDTRLILKVAGIERYNTIMNDATYYNSDHALLPEPLTVLLNANDTITLNQIGYSNTDFVGFILSIAQLPDVTQLPLTINANPAVVTTVLPFVNATQNVPINVPLSISASRYVGCPNVYAFDHWVAGANAVIADPSAAETTVTTSAAGAATITAVYVDGRTCDDECYPAPFADLSTPPDCKVDLDDLRVLAEAWLTDVSPQ